LQRKGTTYPRVSVIILNWNGLKDTIECLESLKKITYPNYDVIVVDNGSKGNDAQVLEEKFGDYIHLIRNDRNYGYTGGNNIGIRYVLKSSSPDYFLILNNDTVVAPDFLDRLIKVAESDASIGIVGSKVYYYDFPNRIQGAGGKVNMRTGQASLIGVKEVDAGQYDTQRQVDYILGCCLLIKKEAIQKVGLFDESYFCYWDETDYCFRAREAGYKVVYTPEAKMWHKAPLKLKVWDKISMSSKASGLPYYFMARNNFKFMRKHATKGQYRSFLFYFFGYQFWFMTGVCSLYHRDVERLFGFYRGAKDGLSNSDSGARHYIEH
jgi:GT2 family glycosyltransferase